MRPSATDKKIKKDYSLLSLAVFVILYFFFVYFNSDNSPLEFMIASALSTGITAILVVFYEKHDLLSPVKIASMLHSLCFSILPVWLFQLGNYEHRYFGDSPDLIMNATATVVLVGHLAMLLAYFIFFRRSSINKQYSLSEKQINLARYGAVIFACLGAIFYGLIMIKSGGPGALLSYSGGRADMLGGIYGGFFWGLHLLLLAQGLFCVAYMTTRPILCFVVSCSLALLYFPLQGRDLIIAPFFCWMIFYNSMYKIISWRILALSALVLLSTTAITGAFRSGGNRIATQNSAEFFSLFIKQYEHYISRVASENIEQFDSAMIAVRYVEKENRGIGPMVLTSWAEPLDRQIFGNSIPSIYSGIFMDRLITPEHKGWNTAISPSFIGELYIGLKYPGVIVGAFFYGMLFAFLGRWKNRWKANPLIFSAYPFVLYMIAKMTIDGSTHLFRPLIVLVSAWTFSVVCSAMFNYRPNKRKELISHANH